MASCWRGSKDGDGEVYHQASELYVPTGCRLIDRLVKPVRGEAILDVGCGTGRLTLELASRVGTSGRAVGVDLGESRIKVAREELAKRADDFPHVQFLEGSVKEAMAWGPFNAIFSNYVFHWFERSERLSIMQDIYESLTPGGRLVFCCLPSQTQHKFIEADIFALAMPGRDYESTLGLKYDSSAVWSQVCTQAGFSVEVCEEYDDEKRSPSLPACLRDLEASVPNFKLHSLKDEDFEFLKKRYGYGYGEEVVYDFKELVILAKK